MEEFRDILPHSTAALCTPEPVEPPRRRLSEIKREVVKSGGRHTVHHLVCIQKDAETRMKTLRRKASGFLSRLVNNVAELAPGRKKIKCEKIDAGKEIVLHSDRKKKRGANNINNSTPMRKVGEVMSPVLKPDCDRNSINSFAEVQSRRQSIEAAEKMRRASVLAQAKVYDEFHDKLTLPYLELLWDLMKKSSMQSHSADREGICCSDFKTMAKSDAFVKAGFDTIITEKEDHILELLFDRIDRNKKSYVRSTDLATGLILLAKATQREKLWSLFRVFDSDDDQCLTPNEIFELYVAIKTNDISKPESELMSDITFNDELSLQEAVRLYSRTVEVMKSTISDFVMFAEFQNAICEKCPILLDRLLPSTFSLSWILREYRPSEVNPCSHWFVSETRTRLTKALRKGNEHLGLTTKRGNGVGHRIMQSILSGNRNVVQKFDTEILQIQKQEKQAKEKILKEKQNDNDDIDEKVEQLEEVSGRASSSQLPPKRGNKKEIPRLRMSLTASAKAKAMEAKKSTQRKKEKNSSSNTSRNNNNMTQRKSKKHDDSSATIMVSSNREPKRKLKLDVIDSANENNRAEKASREGSSSKDTSIISNAPSFSPHNPNASRRPSMQSSVSNTTSMDTFDKHPFELEQKNTIALNHEIVKIVDSIEDLPVEKRNLKISAMYRALSWEEQQMANNAAAQKNNVDRRVIPYTCLVCQTVHDLQQECKGSNLARKKFDDAAFTAREAKIRKDSPRKNKKGASTARF